MGYRIIYVKNNRSYSVLEENDPDYVLVSAVYHREKRTVGTLRFQMTDSHPSYGAFEKFKGRVYLSFNGSPIFTARIYDVKTDMNNIKTVECESLIAFLNDSVIGPYKFNRLHRIFSNAPIRPAPDYYPITGKDFINDLLDEHNSQVNEEQRIFLNATTSDILKTEISTESSGFSSAWDVLSSMILNNYGGDIDLDLTKAEATLNFIDAPGNNVAQEVRYGFNLRDINVGYNSEFATSVRPVSTYTDDDGSTHTIDISSVNSGSYYITNQSAAAAYGRINKHLEFKGVKSPAELYNLSVSRLNAMSKMRLVTNLRAIDMYALDNSFTPIKTGQLIRAVSEPHGLSFTAEVIAFDADLLDPGNSEYTIDSESLSLTKILKNKI